MTTILAVFLLVKLKNDFLKINSSKIGAQTIVISSITISGNGPLKSNSLIDDWFPDVELISLNTGNINLSIIKTMFMKVLEATLTPYNTANPIPNAFQNLPFLESDVLKSVFKQFLRSGTTTAINDKYVNRFIPARKL